MRFDAQAPRKFRAHPPIITQSTSDRFFETFTDPPRLTWFSLCSVDLEPEKLEPDVRLQRADRGVQQQYGPELQNADLRASLWCGSERQSAPLNRFEFPTFAEVVVHIAAAHAVERAG